METPPAYKELNGWKVAQPQDTSLRGKWWEIYGDSQLNDLEEQVNVSNQNIAAAEDSFLVARAMVKEARSQLFPTVTVGPGITVQRASSSGGVNGSAALPANQAARLLTIILPFDATYR